MSGVNAYEKVFYNFILYSYIVCCLTCSFFPVSRHFTNIFIFDNDMRTFNDGWEIISPSSKKGNINVPNKIKLSKGETLVIKNTLPEIIKSDDRFFTEAFLQSIKLTVDGKTIYDTFPKDNCVICGNLGKYWVNAKLDKSQAGKEITLTLLTHNNSLNGNISNIMIGSEGALYKKILSDRPLWHIMYWLLIIASFAIIFYYFFAGLYKEGRHHAIFLALFSLILGLWYLGQSTLLQFFQATSIL